VDYVGGHPATVLMDVERIVGHDVECALAQALGMGPVPGFGASDCDCAAHLAQFETVEMAQRAVKAVADRHR
jgi:endonuclease-3